MKSFKLYLLGMVAFAGFTAMLHAATQQSPYSVVVTTVIPNSSTSGPFISTNAPTIGGLVRIRKLFLSNDGAVERVSLWKNCGSTNTATLVWDGIIPSSAAAGTGGNLNVDFLPDSINVSSVCISKGLLGSGTIRASYLFQ